MKTSPKISIAKIDAFGSYVKNGNKKTKTTAMIDEENKNFAVLIKEKILETFFFANLHLQNIIGTLLVFLTLLLLSRQDPVVK